MKRDFLKNLLEEYHPQDLEEIDFKNQILEFIDLHEDCFERTLKIGHITASAWLLSHDDQYALLMHHAKLDQWMQLGGHCDGDPNVLAVAIREAQEESGILSIRPIMEKIFDLDVHQIPQKGLEPAHIHYDIRFLLRVDPQQEFKKNEESKELRWVSQEISKLPTHSRSILRMVEKWIRFRAS